MMIQRTRKTVVGGHKSGYFALCCETPLKVMVGNSGPWAPKTASFRRRHWPDSVRRGGFDRTVFPAHRLAGALWRHVRFAQRNNRYSISESLKALLYPLVLGLGRIETTEPLRYNGVFHYLAGLPGYPGATSLRRFLGRFARSGRSAFVQF